MIKDLRYYIVTILRIVLDSKVFHFLPDKQFLKIKYRLAMGEKLDINAPKTFNEKLQWIKLYDRKKIYTQMVDKHESKLYVESVIGEKYIIPTYAIFNNFDEIVIEDLPEQFVIKCTHDSGGLAICKDKNSFDFSKAKEKINKTLNKNYYWHGREWPYKNVKPRIIVEKYMIDEKLQELRDYKFFCFNGKVKCFKVDFDRFVGHRANYYDRNKQLMHFGEKVCPPQYDKEIELPDEIEKMIDLAEILAKNTLFIRVDFYLVNGSIYFGELTLFPSSGMGPFIPNEWDNILGEWISLV